jgi:hypothetical protein
MNPDALKDLAALLHAQRELQQHASLQPLIAAVRHARASVQTMMEAGGPVEESVIQTALDAASQALKRRAAAPPSAADSVKRLHAGLNKLGRSIEKLLPQAENVDATIPPLPPASQPRVRQQLLGACALSLATLGHVDAAHQLAASLSHTQLAASLSHTQLAASLSHACEGQVTGGGSSSDHTNMGHLPSTFDLYRTAAALRRRLEQGDAAAAAETELLLRKGGDRLLLLKLHRAVVLQLLISGKPAAAAQVQARTP